VAIITLPALAQDPPEHYYDNVDDSSPAALRASLHEIIDDHQRFPYTSDETDTWDVLEVADQDPADESRIVTLYRNSSHARVGGGNAQYNREHTWPRSFGFPDNDGQSLNYPFTDMHHLFLADPDYNFQRSNKPFQDCDAQCSEWATLFNAGRGGQGGDYPADSNWTRGEFTAGRWEVWSERRGDIARAMFYMAIRYEGGLHGVTGAAEPDLELTNDRDLIDSARTGNNESRAWMGILDSLVAWHLEDPVDEVEIRHHETVAAFQGNRNPFIDNPGWAGCIWLEICGFQVNAGLNDAWFDPATPGQGYFITVFPVIGKMFLANFTFDTMRPAGSVPSIFGEAGHRWVTAFGAYDGDSGVLEAELTQGGLFNASLPQPDQAGDYGTYTVEFQDCMNGIIRYSFPGLGLSGEIPITRLAADNASLCETLNFQAQMGGS
jgi:endonuclease I